MGKGEITRHAILERATALASRSGLEGISIGHLAEDLGLSKSGLFAHFGSKEALQVEILRFAAERFVENVVRPALAQPRGEPRVRAIFERWIAWDRSHSVPGGCLFVAAASELDDRPGPARDELVRLPAGLAGQHRHRLPLRDHRGPFPRRLRSRAVRVRPVRGGARPSPRAAVAARPRRGRARPGLRRGPAHAAAPAGSAQVKAVRRGTARTRPSSRPRRSA